MGENRKPFAHVRRALRVIEPLVSHFVILLIILTLMRGLEYYINLLWGENSPPMLYGTIPWKWVFDSIDLALILIFAGLAARDCYREFRG
jgi:hypothetical protein